MSESGQRQRVVKILKPLHAVPVENPVRPGTPDVNYTGGWIELKWLRRWPVNADTTVRIEHFTKIQQLWLRRRWAAGGRSWLLLQCSREWLLFTGPVAAEHVGLVDRARLIDLSYRYWKDGIRPKELMECLLTDWETLNVSQTPRLS